MTKFDAKTIATPGQQAQSPRAATPPPPTAEHPAPSVLGISPTNHVLVNLLEPESAAAEEYRKLKSALVKLTADPSHNSLMVTSSVPGEGKSITAINLAITLSQELDHTVLLIDADLRAPSLHRHLGLPNGTGLADVLSGGADVASAIIPTGIGKLSVMRGGREVQNPVELFSSQKMKGLVEELKSRYRDRYLIFDTPPLLPFAESRSLAHLVDGVLLVVRERSASQGEIREALESIVGATVLGVVYNAAEGADLDKRYTYYRGPTRSGA